MSTSPGPTATVRFPAQFPARLRWIADDRGAFLWILVVAIAYAAATIALAHLRPLAIDRAMHLAINFTQGRLDLGPVVPPNDTVTIDGRTYQVISLLPIVPYLPFVPFPGLWAAAHWIIPAVLGIFAGWLALPLARRYGAPGATAYWIAALAAFGTLLFNQAIRGGFYYLAHVEAVLLTFVALIEWRGRRRPWVLGLALGLAGLARPTVVLAAIPFGIALFIDARDRVRSMVEYALPVLLTLVVAGLYNYGRFGSPFETGYGMSVLTSDVLARRRAGGLFALHNLPYNLGLLIARGFDLRARFPYLVPDENGHSILLTSPALLAAVGAGIGSMARPLWAAAILVAIPVLLYYGGGGAQTYGFRYALDFIPFLIALVAIASRTRFGALEKVLILLSIAFVSYGLVWQLYR